MNRDLIQDEGSENPMNLEQLEERMKDFLLTEYKAVLILPDKEIAGYCFYRIENQKDDGSFDIYVRQYYIKPEKLCGFIYEQNTKIVPPCMVIYHDPGYKEEGVDAEVIEPIMGDLSDTDRIKVKLLEGVKEMACVVHKGPFQTLHTAYNAISKWIEENGYEIAGSQRELYLKGEWITSDPNEYVTEIQFPVRKE